MTEVPPILFIVTSTALVLGAAITVRGLIGFRPVAETGALPAPVVDRDPTDLLLAQSSRESVAAVPAAADEPAPSGETAPSDDAAPSVEDTLPVEVLTSDTSTSVATGSTPPVVSTVRDLREPIVMTIAGIMICMFTLLAISALIHSG